MPLTNVIILIAQPYSGRDKKARPKVDIEFWRKGTAKCFISYEDVNTKNFVRLCRALNGLNQDLVFTKLQDYMSIDTEAECMTINYRVD